MSGCSGLFQNDGSNPDEDLNIRMLSYQPGIIRRTDPETMNVVGDEEGSYLFLKIGSLQAPNKPNSREFKFHFDNNVYSPLKPSGDYSILPMGGDVDLLPYNDSRKSGWLLYRLPEAGAAKNARLSWPDGEWSPNKDLRMRLSSVMPNLSMDVTVPEMIGPDTHPSINMSVQNTDTNPGRYVAALNRKAPEIPELLIGTGSDLVPPGETKTLKITDRDLPLGHLEDLQKSEERQVTVEYELSSIPEGGNWKIPVEISN